MRIVTATLSYSVVDNGPAERLSDAATVTRYLRDAFDQHAGVESFWTVLLNTRNFPIARTLVTLGTATASLAHPREVFRAAIIHGASAVIIAHNHPSGDPAPSSADIQITRQLREASRILNIEIVDHVIVGWPENDPAGLGYYSFRDSGLL